MEDGEPAAADDLPMNSQHVELAARVDVLALVVRELARVLTPAQAAGAAEGIRRAAADLAVTPATDEATAAALAPVLAALA